MKYCRCCKATKPDELFYGKAKLSTYCKPCVVFKSNEWREANLDRKRQHCREWIKRHPERKAAMLRGSNAVYKAIQKGVLVRPATCSKCGSGGAIEAAHASYEALLDVTWLCRPCHRQWDHDEPKSNAALRT